MQTYTEEKSITPKEKGGREQKQYDILLTDQGTYNGNNRIHNCCSRNHHHLYIADQVCTWLGYISMSQWHNRYHCRIERRRYRENNQIIIQEHMYQKDMIHLYNQYQLYNNHHLHLDLFDIFPLTGQYNIMLDHN
jgi:hypothetical protein